MGYKFGIDARYKQKPSPGFWRGFFLFDDFNKGEIRLTWQGTAGTPEEFLSQPR
jgi:hypothetical protein